ncbi:MAG: arginine--tRNA ligase [Bacteroidales bacterium]
MRIENIIAVAVKGFFAQKNLPEPDSSLIQLQKTRKEFRGDVTLVVFPLIRLMKKSPAEAGEELGNYLSSLPEVTDYNVIKGFLNLVLESSYWTRFIKESAANTDYGFVKQHDKRETVLVEFSSPNTNKPLHLGHIRNNLLGYSISRIIEANGKEVKKVNLVNDRGIHICKTMLAWQKWGNNRTPDNTGIKGDHFVGDMYVMFEKEYRKEVDSLVKGGMKEDQARMEAPLIEEAREMLRKWESDDPEVTDLWKRMNGWVYDGFDVTYKRLGVSFDKIYYESETYHEGKKIVEDGLNRSVLKKKEDGSVWADLTDRGLDEKLLLRSDGTSVYITQDLGTAVLRQKDYNADKMYYVVGNEQDYHFKVLSLILDELGYDWARSIEHISYGMVELPSGKMKSREGKVVDADNLIDEMTETAGRLSLELGKLDGLNEGEREEIVKTIGMGALKYFILKVDPKKNMVFNPEESIDFNGNTGPFIQYTYARICSLLRKAEEQGIATGDYELQDISLSGKETRVAALIHDFPLVVREAGRSCSPALIANLVYDMAKEYNQFYHDHPVIRESNMASRNFRLLLTELTGSVIKKGMGLLGIEVPDKM